MEDLIDKAIKAYARKGKTIEAIRKYIRNTYNVSMDMASLKARLKKLNIYLKPDQSL